MMAAPVANAARDRNRDTAVTEMVSEAETETGSETETEQRAFWRMAPTPARV